MGEYTAWKTQNLKGLIPDLDGDNPDSLVGKAMSGLEGIKDVVGEGFNQFMKDSEGNIIVGPDGEPVIDLKSVRAALVTAAQENIPTLAGLFDQFDQIKKMREGLEDSLDQISQMAGDVLGTWTPPIKLLGKVIVPGNWSGGALDKLKDFVEDIGNSSANVSLVGFSLVGGHTVGCEGKTDLKATVANALNALDMGATPENMKASAVLLVLLAPSTSELESKMTSFKKVFKGVVGSWTVKFKVTAGGSAISGVKVSIDGGVDILTDANGEVNVGKADGSYSYKVYSDNYNTVAGTVVVDGSDIQVPIALTAKDTWDITFTVSDADGTIDRAKIYLTDGIVLTTADGGKALVSKGAGTYNYLVEAEGYNSTIDSVTVGSADVSEAVTLTTSEITFVVKDGDTPIEGALVAVTKSEDAYTDENGEVMIKKENGSYSYSVSAEGYTTKWGYLTVADADQTRNVAM